MGINQYLHDIVKSHTERKICGKLLECGLFDFWNNRISNSKDSYSLSQSYHINTSQKKYIKISFSEYDNERETWVEHPGVIKTYNNRIDYIVNGNDENSDIIRVDSKEDIFNISLTNDIKITFETLLYLQSLTKNLQDTDINCISIFYGSGEEKKYGY